MFEDAGLSFSSQLDQGAHKLAVVEITSENIEALIHSLKFLSPEVLKLQMSDLDSNILLMFGRVLLIVPRYFWQAAEMCYRTVGPAHCSC